ncbi:hypothetical protein RSO01_10150 [Reyranella soli]|uniref:Methyltransferase domain-containing protein n=1 Tax=Reyranella soli TaxID=1230389 RepID=A0A512N4E0_9HYPH|nr:hypothetical protein [Reyranella soli]GEP53849.1 hypothetical protein RSO01_10150 [Reyranella soli]
MDSTSAPTVDAPLLDKMLAAAEEAATVQGFISELTGLHGRWMGTRDAGLPADELYLSKLVNHAPLEPYELALTAAIAERYPVAATHIVEIGSGWGGFAILLARLGFNVTTYEGNAARHAGCSWHAGEQARTYPTLRKRLRLVEGLFPEVFRDAHLVPGKLNICVATNITSTYCAEHEGAMIAAAAAFDELILDLARFGVPRDAKAEREAFFAEVTARCFSLVEKLVVDEPYEYWRFRSRSIGERGHRSATPELAMSRAGSVGIELPVTGRRTAIATHSADKRLTQCPVCHSADFSPLWAIPMTDLSEPLKVFDGYFTQIPTLQVPSPVFAFGFCRDCESIFLNPVSGNEKATYRGSDHYIRKMQRSAEWKAYEQLYDRLRRWIPSDATTMIDAACGIGQYLEVARKREPQRWKRLIGLELAEKYVEHMRKLGLEAHAFDIDNDDLQSMPRAAASTSSSLPRRSSMSNARSMHWPSCWTRCDPAVASTSRPSATARTCRHRCARASRSISAKRWSRNCRAGWAALLSTSGPAGPGTSSCSSGKPKRQSATTTW